MFRSSMYSVSKRLKVMEHVEPTLPSSGLHDHREFCVARSPSWNKFSLFFQVEEVLCIRYGIDLTTGYFPLESKVGVP